MICIRIEEIETAIVESLERMARFVSADRANVFWIDEEGGILVCVREMTDPNPIKTNDPDDDL